jgi:hypothetical protein
MLPDEPFIKAFAARFRGRVSAYGRYYDGPDKKVKTLSEPLPPAAWADHLDGKGPYLGVIPIREDNTASFGAIDVDDDGVDHHELEAQIVGMRLPLVVCRSKSGGAHLYLFTTESVPAATIIEALKKFRQTLGRQKNANGMPVEIFPKQARLTPGQTGNWINLPYYNHENTNRYAVTGGRQLDLIEFLTHAKERSVSPRKLLEHVDASMGPFGDGPSCLQTLHLQGFPAGGRNSGLLNVGIYFKIKDEHNWEEHLREYNSEIEEPLDENELGQIIRNLTNHDYCFTCKNHPIEAVCQKKQCKTQTYGIGYFAKQQRLASLPTLEKLVKVNTDPPRYRVNINGVEVPCSLEEIQAPLKFKNLVFSKLNKVMTPPKQHEWDELLQELVDKMTEEDAPEEAGGPGLLVLYLQDFLQSRRKSDSVDDVLLGRAAIDDADGRVYFTATAFQDFLQRRNFRRYDIHEVYNLLKDRTGLQFGNRTLKGSVLSLWSVPEPKDDQSEPFAYPAARAQPIY